MRARVLTLITLMLGGAGCGHAPAAASIPPPAASMPLEIEAPEPHEVSSVEPPRPERCEAPPKGGIAEPDFAFTRRHIEGLIERAGVPSIAVAVARDGEILWEEGFGLADRRRRKKADEHTMYSLASISKPFTSTAIMVLRERGKLRLEQPISELLPEPGVRAGAGDAREATVMRVASHTAGLPLHWQFYYEDRGVKPPASATTREHYAVTITEPGERYQYSNLGFGLLDQVVAHVSGRSYAQFMQAEVFEPLDLRHTFVGRPPRGSGTIAVRHDAGGQPIPDYGFDHDGASALYSSAHDLVRFGMAHIGQLGPGQTEILPEAARTLMAQPVAPSESYGLGLGSGRHGAVARVGHSGGMPGVGTRLQIYPEQGVTIVVLGNAGLGREFGAVADLIEAEVGMPWRADSICRLARGHRLVGSWAGELGTIEGPRALKIEVRPSGEITATLGGGPVQTVRGAGFEDGVLSGWFVGDASAELAEGRPTLLMLELRLRGDVLEGGVSARVPQVSTTTLFARLAPES